MIATLSTFSTFLLGVLTQTQPVPGQGGVVTTSGATPATTSTTGAPVIVTPDIIWRALLPLIVLVLGAILLLTFTSLLHKRKLPPGFYATYTIVVAVVAILAAVPLWAQVQGWDHILWWHLDTATIGPFSTIGTFCGTTGPACGAIGVDGFGIGITFVICAAIILGSLVADGYLRREGLDGPELYVLMLLSGAGGVVMAMANDLIVLFLGLETLSIAVYVLAAMHRKRAQSQEAGLKYFVLGAFSSAFFLYGIAMVYGATATTNLVNIKNQLAATVSAPIPSSVDALSSVSLNSPLLLLGLGLMLVGLGFKVSAVPFHFWSPDVYDGSPTPVVAFMASGVKAAGFAALVRVFVLGFTTYGSDWQPIVAVLAALSMVVGSILAIVQTNVKRTLAYSSISHAGFILMALQASSTDGTSAILFYLVAYTFMVAGSFAIVALVARRGDGKVDLDDYRGLSESNSMLAFVFTVFLLAQAGVPFTSGFVAKLYTIIAAVDAGSTWLAIIGMVSSVIAAYLYLRIIVAMYMSGSTEDGTLPAPEAGSHIHVPFAAGLALAICFIVTIGVGVFPGPLTNFSADGRPAAVDVNAAPPTSPDQLVPGGASPSGGATSSGGASPSGGATSSGGASPSGGATSSGGASPSGGATSSGGASPSGGATSSGGASPSGGATSSGGASPSGGATSSGGASSSGSGGASSSGGATSSGGASSSGSSGP